MSAVLGLIEKELRQHGLMLMAMAIGYAVLLAISINPSSVSMPNTLPVFLIAVHPVCVLVFGELLVVREYCQNTREFLISLPVSQRGLLLFKFFAGLALSLLFSLATVFFFVASTWRVEAFTGWALLLICARACAAAFVVWAYVFATSMLGWSRLFVHLFVVFLCVNVTIYSKFDLWVIPPLSLLVPHLLIYERFDIPWDELRASLLLGLGITLSGFIMATIVPRFVSFRLQSMLSPQQFFVLLAVSFAFVISLLLNEEQPDAEVRQFETRNVLRDEVSPVALNYRAAEHREHGEVFLKRVSAMMQQTHKLLDEDQRLPIRLTLSPNSGAVYFRSEGDGSGLMTVNFLNLDSYETATTLARIAHSIFLEKTHYRGEFPPLHWPTVGVSRWLAEQSDVQLHAEHQAELIALAVVLTRRFDERLDLSRDWQLIQDSGGDAAAEAVAYSAVSYLQHSRGDAGLEAFAREFLTRQYSGNALDSVSHLFNPFPRRFERVAGVPWKEFLRGWRDWLKEQAGVADVAALLHGLPTFETIISHSVEDSDVVVTLNMRLTEDNVGHKPERNGRCVINHGRAPLYDTVAADNDPGLDLSAHRRLDCFNAKAAGMTIRSYDRGERIYVVTRYHSQRFHEPLRTSSNRIKLP